MNLATRDALPAHALPGWYGKLSILGDFAQRRLPPHVVQRCDAWLSGLMLEMPSVLGSHWLKTYLTAPVLNFVWTPGVLDTRWWFGILMPSCDNVGRYFPLLIAQERSQPPVDGRGLAHLERWYGVLTRAALHTLQDDASAESFEHALAAAPLWPACGRHASSACLHGVWRHVIPMLQGRVNGYSTPAGTEWKFLQTPPGASSWWPHGETLPGATARCWPGLPSGVEFSTLLNAGA
ncbi:MAG TPA: type VI secretion system-associated protein TagF [Burkholderiaceae bacterium]|nr:type VI secretion system-associated protein TagF [Burkholderiaceae bacterium]